MSNTANINVDKKPSSKVNIIVVLTILMSLILMLNIMIINYRKIYQSTCDNMVQINKNYNIQKAEKIEMFFARHKDMLLSAAEILEFTISNLGNNEQEIKTILYNLSNDYNNKIYKEYTNKDFRGIYAGINGKMVHAYKTDADLDDDYDIHVRPWYLEGVSGNCEVVFGEPYEDIYDPYLWVISVTKLLSDNKTVIGMDIPLEDMQYLVKSTYKPEDTNTQIDQNMYDILLTSKGMVISHWDSSQQRERYFDEQNDISSFYLNIKNLADNNNLYSESYINNVKNGVFHKKLNNGWYVFSFTDIEKIESTVFDFAKIILMGTAFIVLICALYCFFILKSYIKSKELTANLQLAINLAKCDNLTNLSNRTAYDMRVKELKERNEKGHYPFAIIMMDLNDLKYINDCYGHLEGDKYIINCCNLIRSIFPCEIYRIGGDEFVLFLTDELYDKWEYLLDRLKQAVQEANSCLTPNVDKPSIAVGLALYNDGKCDVRSIIRKADTEMYTNKVAIKQARLTNSENGYNQNVKLKVLDKQMLASELRKGLQEEQFDIWFQPQVNHENNGTLIGAEALVRWNHPTRGNISPSVFIPLFEYNGLIYELDKYVWKHTCANVRRWIDEGMNVAPVSINISRLDIIQEDFINTIISFVREYNVPYYLLRLEVTESAFLDDTGNIVVIVKNLIKEGFTVAIDDFGSGYSSLSLLRNVPAHVVKLDMRFFGNNENQARNDCIIESIVRMSKMLGMAVLAEGVETIEQADHLLVLGCSYVQGYLYSKPLPYDEYIEYAKKSINETMKNNDGAVHYKAYKQSLKSENLFHNIISGTNDIIIVVDNETKQLLYANSAAEKFYGKRFDPLKPTDCMKYCNKGEICNNCPAKEMKQGEKREWVYTDNGSHIKTLYTQMDWNGHDAVVIYQTDISAEIHELEYADSLLNNLGMAIVVFKGEGINELKPIYCNKEYLQLSGLSEDNYKDVLSKKSMYGIHPNDYRMARAKFIEGYKNKKAIHCAIRVKKPKGKYEWVALYAKIKYLVSGGFEVYMSFSDAEEEMKKKTIEFKRYQQHIVKLNNNDKNSLSLIHLNLTKNVCRNIHRDIKVKREALVNQSVKDFLLSVVNNIEKEELRVEFLKRFSLSTLKANFKRGIFYDELKIPIHLSDDRIIWCNQTVNISQNPTTRDLEAVMSLSEDDKDIRLAKNYKRLINDAYEFVGNIDVNTSLVTVIKDRDTKGFEKINNDATLYMKNLVERVKILVDKKHVDECINKLDYKVVLDQLKKQDFYVSAFPANKSFVGYDALYKWSFHYVDKSKTEILFSRRLITKVGE